MDHKLLIVSLFFAISFKGLAESSHDSYYQTYTGSVPKSVSVDKKVFHGDNFIFSFVESLNQIEN